MSTSEDAAFVLTRASSRGSALSEKKRLPRPSKTGSTSRTIGLYDGFLKSEEQGRSALVDHPVWRLLPSFATVEISSFCSGYHGAMSILDLKAFRGLLFLLLGMAALLFVPAWTLDYWQAWTFLAVYFVASVAITLYLMNNDPELLARRMRGGPTAETATTQKIIMSIASLGFIGLVVVPALDHRFGWSHMPPYAALTGDVLVGLGFLIVFFVFKENSFSSATIELAPGQKVISTGPYALVRHPMYAGGLFLLAGIPIALGSWWGLLVIAALMPALIWRLYDEEDFLARNLPGYAAYRKKVRYRLIPLVW
jgi:protein-S-isoprenylcysteine O-methyltransferase Ste14